MQNESKNPTIVHFEIPADDVERARKFYSTLFGWKIEKPEGEMDYWMISTSGDSNDKSSLGAKVWRPLFMKLGSCLRVPSVRIPLLSDMKSMNCSFSYPLESRANLDNLHSRIFNTKSNDMYLNSLRISAR